MNRWCCFLLLLSLAAQYKRLTSILPTLQGSRARDRAFSPSRFQLRAPSTQNAGSKWWLAGEGSTSGGDFRPSRRAVAGRTYEPPLDPSGALACKRAQERGGVEGQSVLLSRSSRHFSTLLDTSLSLALPQDRIILVVSHDRYFLDEVCGDTLHISGVARRLTQSKGSFTTWAERRRCARPFTTSVLLLTLRSTGCSRPPSRKQ